MMRITLCAGLALSLGGCASVVRGTDASIAFRSEPTDATLSLSNGMFCPHTPCDLKIARKDDFTATFKKDGYQPGIVHVGTHLSGGGIAAGAGNILVGGAIGIGVDAYNGANLDHDLNAVTVHLVPIAPATPTSTKAPRRRTIPTS